MAVDSAGVVLQVGQERHDTGSHPENATRIEEVVAGLEAAGELSSRPVTGRRRIALTPIPTMKRENAATRATTGKITDQEIWRNSTSVLISITEPRSNEITPPMASNP